VNSRRGELREPRDADPHPSDRRRMRMLSRRVIVHRKRVQGFKFHPNFDLVLTQVTLQ
jgi:hypothetical protein